MDEKNAKAEAAEGKELLEAAGEFELPTTTCPMVMIGRDRSR